MMQKNKLITPTGKDYVSPQCTCLLVRQETCFVATGYTIPDIVEEEEDW